MMLTTRAKKLPPCREYYLRQIKLFKSICGDMMFLLTKRKEIMPPHRGGDLRQIKLWRYDVDEKGRKSCNAHHRGGDLSQIKLLKSNCGDMMSTKRGKKLQLTSQRR